ncbi:MAG TPA: YfiR/HmsC family protein [Sulfuricurvum sp.]|nr:YfiR/HmsC family protein [Sulfuricurvum sp.]
MANHFLISLFTVTMILNSIPLYASTYDEDVLTIYSKVVPRFILMSSQKNTLQDKMEICVLHDKLDERIASSLMDKITTTYPNGIKNYKIKLIESDYSDLEACRNSQLIFIFDTDDKNVNKTIKFSNKHTIFTMAYDAKYLEHGVHASLFLGRKVTPYINLNGIRKNEMELDNTLVRISKIYSNEDVK